MNWIFLLSTAGLVAVALSLLLVPMLRHAPQEGERRPVWGAAALAGVLVAGSAGLYAWIGTPEGLSPAPVQTASEGEPQSMAQAVAQLERRLRDDPENLDGWMLLGRSRMATGDSNGAVSAYRRAREIAPDRPDVLVALAEAIAQASGHRLTGEPEALLDEALRHDPAHQRALWFAGIADWQAGAYEEAAAHWETLLGYLEPGSEVAQSVREQLQAARTQAGGSTGEAAPAGDSAPVAREPADPATITVSVRVADAFRERYAASDLVFVFARPSVGPAMPLAVKRFPAGQLPTTVTLGPQDAMTAENALAAGREIVVTARISKTGSATPQAGDLEGGTDPVIVGDTGNLTVTVGRELGRD